MKDQDKNAPLVPASAPVELGQAPVQFHLAPSLQSAELLGLSQMSIPSDPAEAQSDNIVNANAALQATGGQPMGGEVHALAGQGVTGAGHSLPHLDQIQSAFGAHDVSGVKAHVGGPAAEAAEALGATAYATGNDVAFKDTPDLHTTAHEAAHIVQQRAGVDLRDGIGRSGDEYEQHADAVADAVVAGEDAAPLLGQSTDGGGRAAVQRSTDGPTGGKDDQEEQNTQPPDTEGSGGAEGPQTGSGTDGPSVTSETEVKAPTEGTETADAGTTEGSAAAVDPQRTKLLGLVGGKDHVLDRLLASPHIDGNMATLEGILGLPLVSGKLAGALNQESLVLLLTSSKLDALQAARDLLGPKSKFTSLSRAVRALKKDTVQKASNLAALATHAKLDKAVHIDALFANLKVTSAASVVTILAMAKVPGTTALLKVLKRPKLAKIDDLGPLISRFEKFEHIGWHLSTRQEIIDDPQHLRMSLFLTCAEAAANWASGDFYDVGSKMGDLNFDGIQEKRTNLENHLTHWAPQEIVDEAQRYYGIFDRYIEQWKGYFTEAITNARAFIEMKNAGAELSVTAVDHIKELDLCLRVVDEARREPLAKAKADVETQFYADDTAEPELEQGKEGQTTYKAPAGKKVVYATDDNQTDLAPMDPQSAAEQSETEGADKAEDVEEEGPTDAEIAEYISRTDVLQGSLGDCYMMAALSSVAHTHPRVIYDAIGKESHSTYTIKLYKRARQAPGDSNVTFTAHDVTINHTLPTDGMRGKIKAEIQKKQSLMAFLKSGFKRQAVELWAVLIEKAIGKLGLGGYQQLNLGGFSSQTFEMLTGKVAEQSSLPNAEAAPGASQAQIDDAQDEKDKAWAELAAHVAANRPLAANTSDRRIIYETLSDPDAVSTLTGVLGSHKAEVEALVPNAMALTTSSVNIMSIRNALYSLFTYSKKGCPMKKAILRQYLIPLTSAVPGHAYSIFRADETAGALPTDPKTRTLTMRNPWGSTIPKCASAMARSAHTDDGTFTIDFDDFLKIFGSLEIGLINSGP